MKCIYLVGAVFLFSGATETASAQAIRKPTVSPYLNLARRGGNPAINYYGLVKPELAFRGAIQQLQQDARATDQTISELQEAPEQLPATGHAAGFQNHLKYFGNLGSASRGPTRAQFTTQARPKTGGR
ncbi:MAG: hypothetical protein L0Y72_18040 [Gemmataceae bacterium]|nr:hypothetical protein [Gemmataceae bacterium]MCI0740951.1 hypothetical protein [Gemmataceae bacterium]